MKKSILALLLAVLMVASLLPAAALADGGITVNGKGSYATLEAALEVAKDDDTIEFEAGVYEIGSVSTGKRVNIEGAGAGGVELGDGGAGVAHLHHQRQQHKEKRHGKENGDVAQKRILSPVVHRGLVLFVHGMTSLFGC